MDDRTLLNGRRALITGITGQDGSYLADLLVAKGYDVWGLVRPRSISGTRRIKHLLQPCEPTTGTLRLVTADLADAAKLQQILQQSQPDEIYHLASQSDVAASFDEAVTCANSTALDTARLLEAVRKWRPQARYFQASSAEMYGLAAPDPWRENTQPRPCSPHGVAKAFGYLLTNVYRERHNIFAVNGILFNHESPRRGPMHVAGRITRAAAEFSRGRSRPLQLGNIDAQRDWGFAGDYVDAMWRLLQHPEPIDCVIASGLSHSLRQWCQQAFAAAALSLIWRGEGLAEQGIGPQGEVFVEVVPQMFRPLELDHLAADTTRASSELGWTSQTTFEQLVDMMVAADMKECELSKLAA